MINVQKSNMVVIEAKNGDELMTRYNEEMDGLTRLGITIEEKIISIERMSAIILYSEKVRLPENLKDEFALRNIYPTCSECPYFVPKKYGTGVCPRVRGDDLRETDAICKFRWMELEKEFERRTDVTQLKSRNDQEERDARKAC